MKESKGIKMCIFCKHLKRINCCCVFYVTRVEVWIVLYPLLYQSIILSLSLSLNPTLPTLCQNQDKSVQMWSPDLPDEPSDSFNAAVHILM